jgi:DNA-binding GntR family transcriptional regulator
LRQQYRLVEQQIRLYIVSGDSKIVDERIVLAHHKAIVDAILAQDAPEAARLAEEHNNSEGKKLLERIERQRHLIS